MLTEQANAGGEAVVRRSTTAPTGRGPIGRVLLVGINYSPEPAGIGPYTTALAESLVLAGHEVRVLTGVPHYPHWQVRDERYRVGNRWSERLGDVDVTRVRHFVPPKADLKGRARMESEFFFRALRGVRRGLSDAVIAVTPSLSGAAAALGAGAGRPVGVIVQDLTGAGARESGSAGGAVASTLAYLEMGLLRRADLVGVITPKFGEVLRSAGVAPDRIVDVENFTHVAGVEADQREARARLGWDLEGDLVVHTGNLGMKQGLEHVVAAARLADLRASNVTFVLVGAGNQRAELERLAAGVRRLRFVDPVDAGDYPYVLAAADALLLHERPGVREMCMPSKLTSYVSAGRPIIAAVEPGSITHDVLHASSAAELVDPGAPETLLLAAESLLRRSGRQAELVAAARTLGINRYSREAATGRYRAFAGRLLEMRHRASGSPAALRAKRALSAR